MRGLFELIKYVIGFLLALVTLLVTGVLVFVGWVISSFAGLAAIGLGVIVFLTIVIKEMISGTKKR